MIIKNLKIERVQAQEQKSNLVSFIASTGAVDRMGDIIAVDGWYLDSYEKNNIVIFNHNANELPIGKGYVTLAEEALLIDIEFDEKDERGAEIARKCREGFLNAVSVGFNPIEAIHRSDLDDNHHAKGADGVYYAKAELLEVSIVTIPANAEAVAAKKLQDTKLDYKQIAKHILEILEEEDRYIVSFAKDKQDMGDMPEPVESERQQIKITDFPNQGDDSKISLRNSEYPLFPLDYAEKIRREYPQIWDEGGNILGNKQYTLLSRIQENNGVPETDLQEEAIKLREAWAARHLEDFRLPGVVAQMKWLVIGSRGLSHMKEVINEEIKKLEEKQRANEEIKKLEEEQKQKDKIIELLNILKTHQ